MIKIENFIKKIFDNTTEEILEELKKLNEEEKKLVYSTLKNTIDRLQKEIIKINFREIKLFDSIFIRDELLNKYYLDAKNKFEGNSIEKLNFILEVITSNFQICHIFLSPRNQVIKGFYFFFWQEVDFISNAIMSLLNRPENWKVDELIKFISRMEKINNRYDYTKQLLLISKLIKEDQFLKEKLSPYFGKIAFYGFRWLSDFNKVEPEIILEGLSYSDFNENTIIVYDYVYINKCDDLLELEKTGYLPREELINITFDNLFLFKRDGIIKGLINFFYELDITDNEVLDIIEKVIALINYPNNTLCTFALDVIEYLIYKNELREQFDLLIEILSYNLNHSIKKIALRSFALIKLIHEKNKYDKKDLIINSLSSFHKEIRELSYKLIKKIGIKNLSDDVINILKNYQTDNSISELEKKELFLIIGNDNNLKQRENIYSEEDKSKKFDYLKTIDLDLINEKYRFYSLIIKNNLENYIKNNVFIEPERIIYSQKSYSIDKKFDYVLKDLNSFIDFILSESNNQDSNLILEIALEGIIKFWDYDITENEKINKKLQGFKEMLLRPNQQNEDEFEKFELNGLYNLLYIWQNKDFSVLKQKIFLTNKKIRYFYDFDLFIYHKTYFVIEKLQSNDEINLLSTPEYFNGWISPIEFSKRFLKSSNKNMCKFDLILALFRIPDVKEEKEKAWDLIKEKVTDLNNFINLAINIAFGDDSTAIKSANKFIDYFIENPPSDVFVADILNNDYIYPSDINLNFRLFNSALRCRYTNSNPIEELNRLSLIDLTKLKFCYYEEIKENVKYDKYSYTVSWYKSNFIELQDLDERIKDFFIDNVFYKNKKINNLYNLITDTKRYFRMADSYPNLLPLSSKSMSNYYDDYLEYDCIKSPREAQYFFDNKFYNSYYVISFSTARLIYVQVNQRLNSIIRKLFDEYDREKVLDFLSEVLRDGRITPTDFAKSLSKVFLKEIIQERKNIYDKKPNFKKFIKFLNELSFHSKLMNKLILLSLEEFLSNDISNISANTSSLIFDLVYDLLNKNNRSLENTLCIDNIKNISESKKKSVLSGKAQLLLEINNINKYPLLVDIFNEILLDLNENSFSNK